MDKAPAGTDTDYMIQLTMDELWHGTTNGYTNRACRCEQCCVAQSIYRVKYRENNLEKVKARNAKWYADNSERVCDYKAKYRADNLEKFKVNVSNWRKANPDKVYASISNRRARKLNQFVESVDRTVVWKRDSGVCYICNLPANSNDWHVDHKIPLSRGGEHSYANVGVTHPHCNLTKSNKILS